MTTKQHADLPDKMHGVFYNTEGDKVAFAIVAKTNEGFEFPIIRTASGPELADLKNCRLEMRCRHTGTVLHDLRMADGNLKKVTTDGLITVKQPV